ncbi:pupal cuticle protein C1B [Scaptodrosophila lebanonensis]|uniref:Pupal cuticle protein C1B n=1 Tax=Drosophila lebanonensis TaxID=7225 RepID=A0A6J2TW62_DROLE|nr:pupal cuticle protein C1B [Scaptodrosophila lebanonensis]
MAQKFIAIATVFAVVVGSTQAGLIEYAQPREHYTQEHQAVAHTQQNVLRNFDGTVSHYSKSLDTPYSSVHKTDTRISNNVYTPAVAKTLTYAAPAPSPTVYTPHASTPDAYVHHQPAGVTYAAPSVTKVGTYASPAPTVGYVAPAVAKTLSYEAPAPTPAFSYASPGVTKTISYESPLANSHYNYAPTATTTNAHNLHGLPSYGSVQTIHYSPAEAVSHMSFDGFGTHWGF